MAKQDYIATNDNAFNAQLTQFNANIGNYSAVLGLTAGQLAGVAADGLYFSAVVQNQQAMQNGAQPFPTAPVIWTYRAI